MIERTGLRILLLTPELGAWGGGIATFYRDFLSAASGFGLNVRVVEGSAFSASASASKRDLDGVAVEQLEAARLSRWHERLAHLCPAPTFRKHLAAAWAMWEQALEGPEFDIVEATDWGLMCVPPVVAGTHPTVILAHASCGQIAAYDAVRGDETSELIIRMIELAAMSAATELQTYSELNARFWERETGRPVTMIRPVWRSPAPLELATPPTEGLVIGRLQSWKGPETLADAMRLLGSRAPTVRWIGREVGWPSSNLTASGYLSERYPEIWGRKLIHEKQLPPDAVRQRQAQALFNLAPSTWDVFNFTAVEAMASMRPTIVSSGAGASEIIDHGVNGFVFPAGDATGLATAIEEVLSLSTDQQAAIGRRAFETVAKVLEPEQIVRARMDRYNAAVAFHAERKRSLPQWIAEACSPRSDGGSESDFLRHQPLRMLARHVADRGLKRILPS